MQTNRIVVCFLLAACLTSSGWSQSNDELTPLCAPYALYPDTLLAQVLAASTYPDQTMAAQVWCTAHPGLQGDALASALKAETWDPSVKALCTFPDVLQKMTNDMDDTRALGQDFLNEKGAVMDCIQSLRAQAQTMGALTTTTQQKVTTTDSMIQIQPTDPNVIYVPTYDDTALYGSTYAYGAGLLAFGTGVALGAAYTNNYGAFNWATHGMYTGAAVYSGAAYRGGAYTGAAAWGHNYGYAGGYRGGYAGGAVHNGSTGVYRGPAGNTSVYHTGTTAAGARGYGGGAAGYRSGSTFATTAGGGYASHSASRGYASMGGRSYGGGGRRR